MTTETQRGGSFAAGSRTRAVGDVDLLDAAAFNACVTGPGGDADSPCDTCDFDNDVDLVDYGAFQIAFTGPFP